jgi:hypothetical protein
MRSKADGKLILDAEVTKIDHQGIWLLIGQKDLFLPYEEFPWFRNASVAAIRDVELLSDHHLHWSQLDIDLAIESIENPEQFPLIAN